MSVVIEPVLDPATHRNGAGTRSAQVPSNVAAPIREKRLTMKALVYHGPGSKAWEDVPKPTITADTDAIVRVDATTIFRDGSAYPER